MEVMEIDDLNFFPCSCGYQVSDLSFYCQPSHTCLILFWNSAKVSFMFEIVCNSCYHGDNCVSPLHFSPVGYLSLYIKTTLSVQILLYVSW